MFKPLFDLESPNILIYDLVDSTSLEAKKIIKSGYAEHGLIIWAKKQNKAYGRYGRNWDSVSGNLSFSFVIENKFAIDQVAIYPFIAALAIKDSLIPYLNEQQAKELQFKWPNDILLQGKKIAGIIFESELQDGSINNMVCGIGVNIASSPQNLQFATSLYEHNIKKNIKLDAILCNIMLSFDKYIKLSIKEDTNVIYEKWLNSAFNLGKKVIIVSGKEEINGIFKGIKNGNLLLVTAEGKERLICTGDVFFSEQEKVVSLLHNVNNNVTFLRSKQNHA